MLGNYNYLLAKVFTTSKEFAKYVSGAEARQEIKRIWRERKELKYYTERRI